jgi:hypothetical protein
MQKTSWHSLLFVEEFSGLTVSVHGNENKNIAFLRQRLKVLNKKKTRGDGGVLVALSRHKNILAIALINITQTAILLRYGEGGGGGGGGPFHPTLTTPLPPRQAQIENIALVSQSIK